MCAETTGSEEAGRLRLRDLYGPAAAALAVALFLWQATRPDGWLEATAGEWSPVFWSGLALWLAAAVLAVRHRQPWWVVPTAPFALYPVVMFALLMAECARGNCL